MKLIRPRSNICWRSVNVVLLLISLTAGSASCVARCVGIPCHEKSESAEKKAPPCHGEKPAQHSAPTQACKHPMLALTAAGVSAPIATFTEKVDIGPVEKRISLTRIEIYSENVLTGSSPPVSADSCWSVVLRI